MSDSDKQNPPAAAKAVLMQAAKADMVSRLKSSGGWDELPAELREKIAADAGQG